MSTDLSLRAFPEDCELWAKARVNRRLAENLQYFEHYVLRHGPFAREPDNDIDRYFIENAQQLARERPGLLEREYYVATYWDKIVYLLSPKRRDPDASGQDDSLIHKAIRGVERLQPEARAGQGNPLMCVPVNDVKIIAGYFDPITRNQFHEHYDPLQMEKAKVYKMDRTHDEQTFNWTWDEFTHVRNLYQDAAGHNEAMIVILN